MDREREDEAASTAECQSPEQYLQDFHGSSRRRRRRSDQISGGFVLDNTPWSLLLDQPCSRFPLLSPRFLPLSLSYFPHQQLPFYYYCAVFPYFRQPRRNPRLSIAGDRCSGESHGWYSEPCGGRETWDLDPAVAAPESGGGDESS